MCVKRRCIAAQGGVLSLLLSARLFLDDVRLLDGEACEPRFAQLIQFEQHFRCVCDIFIEGYTREVKPPPKTKDGVVSLHRCVLPYKYRRILEMLPKFMKLCERMGSRPTKAKDVLQ